MYSGSGAIGELSQGQTVKQLKPTAYEIEGGGGNSTVITNTGVIVVDAKTTEAAGKALVAEIAKITPKPAQKVVATGDIITTNRSEDNPFIHPEKNGSTAGWIANAKGMARLDADTYVVGHGHVLKKADMEERAKRLEERRSKIAAMAKDGKSLEQIKAALPEAPAPPPAVPPGGAAAAAAPAGGGGQGAPGAGRGPQPTFTDLAYQELTKK